MSEVNKNGMCTYLAETCVAYQIPVFTKTLRDQGVREENIQGKVDAFSKQYLAKVAEAISDHYSEDEIPLLSVAYKFHQGALHQTLSGIFTQAVLGSKEGLKSSAFQLGMWLTGMGSKPELKPLPEVSTLPVEEQSVEQLAASISKITGEILAGTMDVPVSADLGLRGTEAFTGLLLNEAAIQRIALLKDTLTKTQLQQTLAFYSSEGGRKYCELTPSLYKSAEALKKVFAN